MHNHHGIYETIGPIGNLLSCCIFLERGERSVKEGRKEGRKEGKKEGKKEGRKDIVFYNCR